MEQQHDPLGTLRREAIRAVLERVQGDMFKGNKGASKGLAFPEPLDSIMRCAFSASDVDYTYEE